MRFKSSLVCIGLLMLMAGCGGNTPNSTEMAASATASTTTSQISPSSVVDDAEATEIEETALTRGAALFAETRQGFACATCHYTSENRLLGPGLANSAERIAVYNPEESLEAYLHTSITNPAAFIAPADPAYPANIMPTTYGELFTEDEINDLIAYIMSL